MLEVGVRQVILDHPKLSVTSLQFKWIIVQYCGMGEATDLGERIKNLTK